MWRVTFKSDGLVRVEAFIVVWLRDGSMNIKVFNLVGCQSTLKSFCQPARLKTLRFHGLTRPLPYALQSGTNQTSAARTLHRLYGFHYLRQLSSLVLNNQASKTTYVYTEFVYQGTVPRDKSQIGSHSVKWEWNSPLKLDGLVQVKVTGISLCQIASCSVQMEAEQSIEIGWVSPGWGDWHEPVQMRCGEWHLNWMG